MSAQAAWHFILWIHFIAAALWAGGIFFIAAVAAPAIHRSMASKALGMQILSQMLKRLNWVEFLSFFILLVTTFSSRRFVPGQSDSLWKIFICLVFMGLVTLYCTFYLSPKLESLKEHIPGMTQDIPAQAEFERFYSIYVATLALNEALALVLLYQSVVIF